MIRTTKEELEDIETSPDRLREIFSRWSFEEYRLLLAKHPSTPLEILLQLGEHYPAEFLQNPIFPLLLLEAPNAALDWPAKTVQALLSCPDIPLMMVESASRHPRELVRGAAAAHPLATEEILRRLSQDHHAHVSGRVAENANTPLEVLHALASHKGQYIRIAVAKNPNTTTETLSLLAGDVETAVRIAVASHPNASEESLTRLVADNALHVRAAVAQHPNAPRRWVDLLASLASDSTYPLSAEKEEELATLGAYGGQLLARRLSTPGRLLLKIVRAYFLCESDVASHPSAPPEALLYLAEKYSKQTRMKVAEHPNTPSQALSLLLMDDNAGVRGIALSHPASPRELISLLQRAGADATLRSIQSAQPLTQREMQTLLDGKQFARELLVRHPDTPPEMLLRLTKSFPEEVACHPRATFAVLKETLTPAPKATAQHPNAGSLLDELAKHQLRGVRYAVANNPTAPHHLLVSLMQDHCREIRYAVARHANAGALCEQFALDPDWLLRRAAARHPSTSLSALWRLAQDPDPRVHRAARTLHQKRTR
jgi:hypothetical protein